MSAKYISIEEATKRAGKDDFLQNVKKAIIPRLIKKGMLNGKKEKRICSWPTTMRSHA